MGNVRDIMATDVISVRSGTSVQELVQLLDEEGISGVPVLDPAGRVVGVVSRTDVIRMAASELELPASDAFWDAMMGFGEDVDDDPDAYFLAPESAVVVLPGSRSVPGVSLEDVTVDEIMTPAGFSVDPDQSIEELARFLMKGRIHRALVLENSHLVGIVTAFDVLRVVSGEGTA